MKILFRGYQATARVTRYAADNSRCLRLFTVNGEPLATATVCLADYGLTPPKGCVFIKDYAENQGIFEALVEAKVVKPTGETVQFGPYGTSAHIAKLL